MLRIGHGYDVHRFSSGRRLIIGGVEIPFEQGLLGHSDADVLLHAISDAMLGAAALGDIGRHFPDTDEAFLNADSYVLLERVAAILAEKSYKLVNLDATIVAQKPKISPYIEKMRQRVATACDIDIDRVNIKATTEEGLGFTGSMEGISAHAVCLIRKCDIMETGG